MSFRTVDHFLKKMERKRKKEEQKKKEAKQNDKTNR
jgi:hypothetical protein